MLAAKALNFLSTFPKYNDKYNEWTTILSCFLLHLSCMFFLISYILIFAICVDYFWTDSLKRLILMHMNYSNIYSLHLI